MKLNLLYEMSTGDIAAGPNTPMKFSSQKIGHKQKLDVDDSGSAVSFQKTSTNRKSVSAGGDHPPQSWGGFKSTLTKAKHKRS